MPVGGDTRLVRTLIAVTALCLCGLPCSYLDRKLAAAERTGDSVSSDRQAGPTSPRAVLRGNDDVGPNEASVGKVTWRIEPANAVGAEIEDVRADVEIPDRKFTMTMIFRRNTDASLPASILVVEMRFHGADVGQNVDRIVGVLLKSDEQARPMPLSGLAAKQGDHDFLFRMGDIAGLNDRSRNIRLLQERSWFEVPLVYADQHRAIIALEKGEPGQRALNEAFAGWGM